MYNRASQSRVRTTTDVVFPAPTKGWVKSGNITTAGLDEAEVLDNMFPTAQTGRLRGGYADYADLGEAVERVFVYSSGSDTLFGSTASGIYNCNRINAGGVVFADAAGMTSGDWSVTQMSNSAGQFLVAVNGEDFAQYYNNAAWQPITGAANNNVGYDALTAPFAVGETLTGGTSGATATITGITQTSATEGTLRVGAITGGPFSDNEAITSASGSATANGASAAGSAVAVTGIATTDLSQVWSFKEQLFFIEKNSLSAWYLPVESIGGTITELPLGAIFRKGGTLVFGATWSLDSGSGIDDVCLFVTSNGEIAVYEGTDPSSATTWSLAGVYDIDRPLNKHAFFKAGGDLAILTADGIIPVSEALRKDRAALQSVAISYPIEDAWKEAVANSTASFPITATLWQSQAMLVIGVQGSGGVAFVANARTGAWCRYVGWDVRCAAVANDALYFGSNDGIVRHGETGGTDGGTAYSGIYVPKFQTLGTERQKVARHAGITVKSEPLPPFRMTAFANYQIGVYPTPAPINTENGASWGTGVWGSFVWGADSGRNTYTVWKSVGATGYSLTPVVVVSSNQPSKPVFEILATRLRFEVTNAL